MDSNGRAQRDAQIYVIDGLTLRAIAREFKLAVETVRVIAKRMECKAKCVTGVPDVSGAMI
jgi:hypothetical protein